MVCAEDLDGRCERAVGNTVDVAAATYTVTAFPKKEWRMLPALRLVEDGSTGERAPNGTHESRVTLAERSLSAGLPTVYCAVVRKHQRKS